MAQDRFESVLIKLTHEGDDKLVEVLKITHETGSLVLTKGHYIYLVKEGVIQHVASEIASVGDSLI